jgi:hypothetical protein
MMLLRHYYIFGSIVVVNVSLATPSPSVYFLVIGVVVDAIVVVIVIVLVVAEDHH